MGYFVLPLLLLIGVVPAPSPSAATLADFDRFSKAVGHRIALVDAEGIVREGVVRAVSSSDVTMQFGSTEKVFPSATIASADRLKDGRVDGAVRGALFGLVVGALASQGARDEGEATRIGLASMALYSAIGWAIDASQTHRQPLYKANLPPPAVKVSLRF